MSRIASINIYADEQSNLKYDGQTFMAIATLFIFNEEREKVIQDLLNLRCLNEKYNGEWYWEYEKCPAKDICEPKYHIYNSMEIHYNELRPGYYSHQGIPKRWLEYFINRNREDRAIPFNILYINLTNLDAEKFGTEKWHVNAYNRFFRMNLKFALKTFFLNNGYDKVFVNSIFHDKSEKLENHPYFKVINLKKLEQEINSSTLHKKSVILPQEITFIDSDHKKENPKYWGDIQLVQLTDLILGVTSQNIFYTAETNTLKKELAMIIRDLVERLLKAPNNPNSSFHYYKKQNISFFPKEPLKNTRYYFRTLDGSTIIETMKDQFYRDVCLKMPPFDPNIKKLDNWLKSKS